MKSIESLKKRLEDDNTLEVQLEKGHVMKVIFNWNDSVTEEVITSIQKSIGYKLPKEYIDLLEITNGAIMFKDALYGQWGYEILPLQRIIGETNNARGFGYNIPESCLVIAKSFGDGDMLLLDLEKYKDGKAYIIDGEQGYQYDEWEKIVTTFDKFIDRLIVAQGAKYWRWK